VPIPLYVYRVQPRRPNHNAATRVCNDDATRLSCERPRPRLSPACHGYFAKGSAPIRMVVQGRECVYVVVDMGLCERAKARVQTGGQKKPPAQTRRGWGHAPGGLHRRRLRGWSRTPPGVLCESVCRVYAHRPRMDSSTALVILCAEDLGMPCCATAIATNASLSTDATG